MGDGPQNHNQTERASVDPFDLLSVEAVVTHQNPPESEHPHWAPAYVKVINHADGLLDGEFIVFRMSVDYLDERGNVLPPLGDDGEWTSGYGTAIVARFTRSRSTYEDVMPYAPIGTADVRIWTTRVRDYTSPTRTAAQVPQPR